MEKQLKGLWNKLKKRVGKNERRQTRIMEQTKTLWDSVNTDNDLKPKIVFNFNEPVDVVFPSDFVKPEEYPSQYGDEKSYCVFKVIHKEEEGAIMTSAFSLLRGLKANEPLANKELTITLKMENGKQQYIVEPKTFDLDKVTK